MSKTTDGGALSGKVVLVAGATRGAGRAIAVELEIDRTETIEGTGELGRGCWRVGNRAGRRP